MIAALLEGMWRCRLLTALVTVAVLSTVACSTGDSEVIATWNGSHITLGDLKDHVASLPQARRGPRGVLAPEAWINRTIEDMAMLRVLAADPRTQELATDTQLRARGLWRSLVALRTALEQQLIAGERPDEAALAAVLESLDYEPKVTFQHITIRVDRPDLARARRRMSDVLAKLGAGVDFASVARRYSESETAAQGGLVQDVGLSAFDDETAQAISDLAVGEISDVVETRTGLHLFRLVRRSQPRERAALERWRQDHIEERREQLLTRLRSEATVVTTGTHWRVGDVEIEAAVAFELTQSASATNEDADPWQLVIDTALLASEARRRGLESEELVASLEERSQRDVLGACYDLYWQELLDEVSEDRLRETYIRNSPKFTVSGAAEVDLIFVPAGADAFATLQSLEQEVEKLRAGITDFAAFARSRSTGPNAAGGGHLGLLMPWRWSTLNPALKTPINSLVPGQVSRPVYCPWMSIAGTEPELSDGFAIVRVRRREQPTVPPFEDAVKDVRKLYSRLHRSELQRRLRARLLSEGELKILRSPTLEEVST